MRNITRRALVRTVAATALALPGAACARLGGNGSADVEELSRTFFNFDTVCVVGGVMESTVLDEAEELCERYERLFSATVEGSDVSRINDAAGHAVEVDPETAELLEASLRYSEESDGLFDVTIGCVSRLWDFHEGVVPSSADIEDMLAHVGYERLRVEGIRVTLEDPKAAIDLGGIAKGYITDRLVELFRERGVGSAFVNLGGNVAVLGAKASGEPWSVGVRDPFSDDASAVVARVHTTSGSVVTSGLYERSFEVDGRRYWHILDPRTGYPVESDVASVSVFCERSIDGDGSTKPPFMLGANQGLRFLEERGLDGLVVDASGELHTTSDSAFEAL